MSEVPLYPLLTCFKVNPLNRKVTDVRFYEDKVSVALDPSCVVGHSLCIGSAVVRIVLKRV